MRWTPPPGVPLEDVIAQLTDKLVSLYGAAEETLLKTIAEELRAEHNPDHLTYSELRRLRQDAQRVQAQLAQASPALIQELVDTAARLGMGAALTVLDAMPGLPHRARRVPYTHAITTVAADLTNALDDVRARVLRLPDDVYRTTIADTTADTLLTGTRPITSQVAAWRRLLDNGITGFIDKAGRNWNLATYVEMASRTALTRAYRAQHEHTMLNNGVRLARVVCGNDMCSKCGPWSGRIVSLDGTPAGTYSMLSAVADETVTVHVSGTVEQARAEGWGHPNCRCVLVAYLPGVEPAVASPPYDPEAEADRDQLRAYERRIRKLKRDLILDGENTLTRARIRATQAKIRELVSTTSLKRQRRREQLNLSNTRR